MPTEASADALAPLSERLKGYIYGAMGFSVFVELINIRTTRKTKLVELNQVPHVEDIPP